MIPDSLKTASPIGPPMSGLGPTASSLGSTETSAAHSISSMGNANSSIGGSMSHIGNSMQMSNMGQMTAVGGQMSTIRSMQGQMSVGVPQGQISIGGIPRQMPMGGQMTVRGQMSGAMMENNAGQMQMMHPRQPSNLGVSDQMSVPHPGQVMGTVPGQMMRQSPVPEPIARVGVSRESAQATHMAKWEVDEPLGKLSNLLIICRKLL